MKVSCWFISMMCIFFSLIIYKFPVIVVTWELQYPKYLVSISVRCCFFWLRVASRLVYLVIFDYALILDWPSVEFWRSKLGMLSSKQNFCLLLSGGRDATYLGPFYFPSVSWVNEESQVWLLHLAYCLTSLAKCTCREVRDCT